MWSLFQPIRTLEILKLCEISWDLLKKYFHLKSNAVYNSSAKKKNPLTDFLKTNVSRNPQYKDVNKIKIELENQQRSCIMKAN